MSKEFEEFLKNIPIESLKILNINKLFDSEKEFLYRLSILCRYNIPKFAFHPIWIEIYNALDSECHKKNDILCSKCGKSAAWNTPVWDKSGNIFCARCAEDIEDTLLYGIEQHRDSRGYVHSSTRSLKYVKNGIVLHADLIYTAVKGERYYYKPNYFFVCWSNYGRTSWKMSAFDNEMCSNNVEKFLDYVHETISKGLFKCSSCGELFPKEEIAGYPLFSGINCKNCYDIHLKNLDEQRKSGRVCSICGQPYGNCSC
jgi:hypothetical protein